MSSLFAKRNRHRAVADDLYRAIVARARHPGLYAGTGVADSFDGRYELLMLHVIVLIRRLRAEGERPLAQAVFDVMFADMDQALREMGVGDLSVSRRIRPMAEAFYGRAAAYDAALAADAAPDALDAAIERNAFPDGGSGGAAGRIAHYVRALATALDRASVGEIAGGRVAWPEPVGP